jgi:hypothetical protein
VTMLGHPERTPSNVLNRYPVEVLAIEDSHPNAPNDKERYWARWLDSCKTTNRPDYVCVMALPRELVEESGLQSKHWRRKYSRWGYDASYWFLRGHKHGGIIRQDRFILMLRRMDESVKTITIAEPINTQGGPRITRNMLQPTGVPHAAWLKKDWTPKSDYPTWVVEVTAPCLIVGETNLGNKPIISPDGCLPDSVGIWLGGDGKRGTTVTDRGIGQSKRGAQ